MHYLECVAMLLYLKSKLKEGQRVQVPIKTMSEALTVMMTLNKKLEPYLDKEPMLKVRIRDVMTSIAGIQEMRGLEHLTDTMKSALLDGLNQLYSHLCMLSFNYFKVHDFEVNDNNKKVLREVVKVALEKGEV